MYLRKLKPKDGPRMLEWIKDSSINQYFRFNPEENTPETIQSFIAAAQNDLNNLHLAIADADDSYLGTVSLKGIDRMARHAEYAIAMHPSAIGTGTAKFATDKILEIAFAEQKLERVYLNVLSENLRAIRFYEKYDFNYEGEFVRHLYHQGQLKNIKWFAMLIEQWKAREHG